MAGDDTKGAARAEWERVCRGVVGLRPQLARVAPDALARATVDRRMDDALAGLRAAALAAEVVGEGEGGEKGREESDGRERKVSHGE